MSNREMGVWRRWWVWGLVCPLLAVLLTTALVSLVWYIAPLRNALVAIEPNLVAAMVSVAIVAAVAIRVAAWRGRDLSWSGESSSARTTFWVTVALAGVCMALFTMPHFFVWTQVPANYSSLAGLFPYSDAKLYYDGALHVISEGDLDSWNMRRPLNALLFSVRLTMAGQSLQGALLIQGVILGAACFFLGRTVAKDLGIPAGLFVVATLYGFSREYVSSTLSESLGVTLGTIATALLWRAARQRIEWMAVLGLLVMTLGLNARAGAFFVLPLVVIWAGFAFRKQTRFNWRMCAMSMTAVVAGFAINSSVLLMYGNGMGIGHGNFAHTLYGLSTGTPDWTRIYRDHPEAEFLEEQSQNSFIYARAWDNISSNPNNLYKGFEDGAKIFLSELGIYTNQVIALPVEKIDNQIHQVMCLLALIFLWRYRREPVVSLVAVANLGLLLSGPIIFPDGGRRVLAVSYPFYFIFFALSFSKPRALLQSASLPEQTAAAIAVPNGETGRLVRPSFELGPAAMAFAFLVAIFVGPSIAQWVDASRVRSDNKTTYDGTRLVTRVGPQSPYLKILPAGAEQTSFIPDVRREDFERHLHSSPLCEEFAETLMAQLEGNEIVMVPYNLYSRGKAVLVIGTPEMIPDSWRDVELTGRSHDAEAFELFFVEEIRYLDGNEIIYTADAKSKSSVSTTTR